MIQCLPFCYRTDRRDQFCENVPGLSKNRFILFLICNMGVFRNLAATFCAPLVGIRLLSRVYLGYSLWILRVELQAHLVDRFHLQKGCHVIDGQK